MNCQELAELLDNGNIRNLPPAKRRELDGHLSGCANCAAEWQVQERIVMTPAMRASAGFVAQCRRLVAAGAARLVPRRVLLYSTLLVMTAAAALLVWRYGTPPADDVIAAVSVIEALEAQAPPRDQPELEAEPEPESTPARDDPQPAPPPGTFAIAVRPLQIEGTDVEGNGLAARFRERVMTLLAGVPNLTLVDMASSSGAATAEFELRMKYTGSTAEPLSRTVNLEVGKVAEFAATDAAIAAETTMSPEDQQRSRLARQVVDVQKRAPSMRSGNAGVAALLGLGAPTLAIIYDRSAPTDRLEYAAQQLIRQLRVNVFPLDESFEQEELATLRDPSQRQALRMRSLGALLIYAERRGGFSRANPAVIRAGGEFALVAESEVALQRSAIWDALALTGSPELVPYLIRGLDEIALTETRLQLVRILAESFGDDPRARAALAAAAKSNDQETVRMAAMRESGDSQWSDYVVAILLDPALPPLQRLQPIADMAPGALGTLGTSPKTKMVLEEQQLRELGALIVKIAPDRAAGEIVTKALFASGAMETPAALDMLIEVLESVRMEDFPPGLERVSVMGVRSTARSLISLRYAGNPKARAVIEKLTNSPDSLERMEAQMQLRAMDLKAGLEEVRQE